MNEVEKVSEMTPSVPSSTGMAQIESSRAVQQVQAQVIMAKQYPRNISVVMSNMLQACQRKGLAEMSMYSYPRGGQQVTGPSIRLAEELARQFGNLDYGIKELEQKDGESVVMAYCHDLETNVMQTKIFTVKHIRDTKKGSYKITDARDIYEMVANNGARRMRACILGVIPGYLVEECIEACEKTLKQEGEKIPIQDQLAKMLLFFKDYGVTQEMLEKRLAHKFEATSVVEVIGLRKIATSLKDGASKIADWFDVKEEMKNQAQQKATEIADRLAGTQEVTP